MLDFFPDQPRVNFHRFLSLPIQILQQVYFFRVKTLFSVVHVQGVYYIHPENRV